jgi:hypothetical protein
MKIFQRYKFIATILAMTCLSLFISSYLNGHVKVAFFWLLTGCVLITSKLVFLLTAGKFKEVTEQFLQWLFEIGIILTISGFTSTSASPIFGSIILFLGVLCILGFGLLVLKNHIR